MNLAFQAVQSMEQWYNTVAQNPADVSHRPAWKGEMDALTARLAKELAIDGIGDVSIPGVFAQLDEMLYAAQSGSEVEVALLVDLDEVQLKGFVSVVAGDKGEPFGKSLVLLHAAKVKTLDSEAFDKALVEYLERKAQEWTCRTTMFAASYGVRFSLQSSDPVSRRLKRFGMKPLYVVYGGKAGEG